MIDQEIFASQVKPGPFPFPCDGDITLAVRNANYALGPVMLHLVMQPGSVIPEHIHEGVAEVLYVTEGEFINDGTSYPPGTSLHVKVGQPHGPHTTKTGCSVLVLWSRGDAVDAADLTDFALADAATVS